jgi:hypothetical protein
MFKKMFKLLFQSTKKEKQPNHHNITSNFQFDSKQYKPPTKTGEVNTSTKSKYNRDDIFECEYWLDGVKDVNTNNVNRQDILAKCNLDDVITLKPYYLDNGSYRIEVYTNFGCIGYFDDKLIGKYLKNGGIIHDAKISKLRLPKTSRGKIDCKVTFSRNKMR